MKGPWPTPSADHIEATAVSYADRYPQWGSRTIATLMRIDGHHAPDSTVYRALKRTGRVLEVNYQAERRQHAEARRAAFVVPPSGPNEVWQLDFTEYTTRMGGTWRIGGIADYWSKLELGGTSRQPRTTATRSRPSRSRSPRQSGCSAARCSIS